MGLWVTSMRLQGRGTKMSMTMSEATSVKQGVISGVYQGSWAAREVGHMEAAVTSNSYHATSLIVQLQWQLLFFPHSHNSPPRAAALVTHPSYTVLTEGEKLVKGISQGAWELMAMQMEERTAEKALGCWGLWAGLGTEVLLYSLARELQLGSLCLTKSLIEKKLCFAAWLHFLLTKNWSPSLRTWTARKFPEAGPCKSREGNRPKDQDLKSWKESGLSQLF